MRVNVYLESKVVAYRAKLLSKQSSRQMRTKQQVIFVPKVALLICKQLLQAMHVDESCHQAYHMCSAACAANHMSLSSSTWLCVVYLTSNSYMISCSMAKNVETPVWHTYFWWHGSVKVQASLLKQAQPSWSQHSRQQDASVSLLLPIPTNHSYAPATIPTSRQWLEFAISVVWSPSCTNSRATPVECPIESLLHVQAYRKLRRR